MLLLGFASGLPLALSSGTLQAWLTVEGLDIATIGFFALAGLPYTFKFVWAPLADRFEPTMLPGRRRSWLLVTQLGLAALCFVMATLDPRTSVMAVGACAVAIAFLSASQDIVFDAYRTDLLDESERGAGAAVSVLGYRLAMLVSGGLALIIADQWLGWPNMFRLMGGLFGLMGLVTLWSPRPPPAEALRSDVRRELVGFVAMLAAGAGSFWLLRQLPWNWIGEGRFARLAADTLMLVVACVAALRAARAAGFPSFLAPWDAFFSREKAAWLLALIVLYKLGDAFAGSLSTSFLIRGAGFTPTEVGAVNKVLGLVATIVGALAGGAWLAKRPLYASLMLFGVLQAVSNFGYWLISVLPKSYTLMAAAIGFENLCGGMGTAAFVAFLMALTDRRFSAAQYALLSALAAVGRVYVGPASGVMVAAFGWPAFFVFTVAAALPGLLLLAWLRPQVAALGGPPEPGRQEPS
ncbi:AmpG family muropeptide MFS transporter [Zeimonas arvi]|uniref:MFS transporter n=1 Tax=Zeimonas arvi TaxID=2498847 RepID=A0A5C8NWL1_9BURK|nr:MFS transporter [Zeimonas arvi]TXL65581.1 MFS transporter [Zeimonas arvi]